jgi:hypothetical protein
MKDEKSHALLRKAEADQRLKKFLDLLINADLKVMEESMRSKNGK